MSTTLTNGLKLPDKGSVDWYADMQSNYQILDGAVGTVAEHTSALSGKAPLVHTHSKADVTDLFNSANTWTGDNTYTAGISYQTSYTLGNPPQNAQAQTVIRAIDAAGTNYLAQISTYQDTDATGLRFTIRDKFGSNGFSPSGSNRNKHFYLIQNISNQGYLKWDGYTDNSIYPLANNTYNLGNSTLKWKTLNGVNPGALSLPSGAAENINTNNWNFSWGANTVTAPFDGYISVACFGSALQINNETKSYAMTFAPGTDGYICGLLPVSSGDSIKVLVTRTQTSIYEGYKFIKASGNVS